MRNEERSFSSFTPHSELRTSNYGVPWPIALLTLFYGVIATASAATVWKIVAGVSYQSLLWPLTWLALSAGAMCGLPLLKSWGRRLAIGTSAWLLLVTLAIAGLLVRAGHPLGGLLVAFIAGTHALAIRYLQRPAVKTLFAQGSGIHTREPVHTP